MAPNHKKLKLAATRAPSDSAAAVEKAPGKCHFNTLPAELRNKIYREVLEDHKYTVLVGVRKSPQPAITRVNKQIRAESLLLYYASTTLAIEISQGVKDGYKLEDRNTKIVIKDFLTLLSDSAAQAIRRIAFVFTHDKHPGCFAFELHLNGDGDVHTHYYQIHTTFIAEVDAIASAVKQSVTKAALMSKRETRSAARFRTSLGFLLKDAHGIILKNVNPPGEHPIRRYGEHDVESVLMIEADDYRTKGNCEEVRSLVFGEMSEKQKALDRVVREYWAGTTWTGTLHNLLYQGRRVRFTGTITITPVP